MITDRTIVLFIEMSDLSYKITRNIAFYNFTCSPQIPDKGLFLT